MRFWPLWAGAGYFAVVAGLAAALGSALLLSLAILGLLPVIPALLWSTRRRLDLLDPVWVFGLLFLFTYAVVPALEPSDVRKFMSLDGYLRLSPVHYHAAVWLSAIGFLAFCLGYFLRPGPPAVEAAGRDLGDTAAPRRALIGGVVLLAGGMLALEMTAILVQAWEYSPRDIFTGTLRDAMFKALPGRGYVSVGFSALGLAGPCLCLALALRATRRPALRRWILPAMVATAALAALVFGAILGSRQLLIATVVELVVVYHYAYRRVPNAVVGAVAVALAFVGVELLSLRSTGRLTFEPIAMAGRAAETFDGFNFLVAELANQGGPVWGRTLVEDLVLTYAPRAIFPDKPSSYGIVAAADLIVPGLHRSVGGGTYPPGILAEGYVNFGVAGIVALPFALGLALSSLYRRVKRRATPAAVLLLGWAMGNSTGFFRGLGPILPALALTLLLLAPLSLSVPRRLRRVSPRLVGALAGLAVAAAAVALPRVIEPVVTIEEQQAVEADARVVGRPPPIPVKDPQRPSLVLFWASWCEDCPEQLAETAAVARTGVKVRGINYQDDLRRAQAALARVGADWPNAEDRLGNRLRDGRVDTLPATFVLDEEGSVRCYLPGLRTQAQLEQALERVAGDAPSCE